MLERSRVVESTVYVYTGATDMRCGFDRLSTKITEQLNRSVMQGGLYVFLSRCRRKMKVLYWDRDSYALWHKRLEAGEFRVEHRDGYEEITGLDLESLRGGMDISRIKLRKNAESGLYRQ